jgi:hypothetical protein
MVKIEKYVPLYHLAHPTLHLQKRIRSMSEKQLIKTIRGILKPTGSPLRIAKVESALADAGVASGFVFSLQFGLSGSCSLVALTVDGEMAITAPIVATDQVISVPLDSGLTLPFDIRWVVLYSQDQPKTTAFLTNGAQVKKLGQKKDASAGATWVSAPVHVTSMDKA